MRGLVVGAHLRREDIVAPCEPMPMRGLFLSSVPIAADQNLADRELVLRVAAARDLLLAQATFVAIRYGFAAWSAEEAEAKCAGHLEAWRSLLTAHRDHVEMTLRIVAETPAERPDRRDFSSGAEYLKALHVASRSAAVAPDFRARVESGLVPLAVDHRWLNRDEKSLELVLLVRRDRVAEVRAAGEELRGMSTPFLLSGPWPLEAFAE